MRDGRPGFEDVVLPHLDAAYGLARWLLRDPALAQDVVQDAMVRALRYFESYRGGDGRAWVLQIVRNAAYEALRERQGRERLVEVPLSEALPANGADPEAACATHEQAGRLEAALARLPVELRECLVLREVEEMSYREIAEVTGAPIGTVMSRLWRARQLLMGAAGKEGG
jgi:RNA polymerase sigma-70 factor (ECF subfamily)